MASRRTPVLLVASFVVGLLAGCGGDGSSSGPAAPTLRVGTLEPGASASGGIDPAQATDAAAVQVTRLLFVGLTTTDDRLQVVPAAAESWTVDPAGRVFRFVLRSGVRFSNGRSVTAGDFAFSFDRLADQDTASPFARLGAPIDGWDAVAGAPTDGKIGDQHVSGVHVVDDKTLEITTTEPFALLPSLLTQLAFAPVPKEEFATADRQKAFAEQPIGDGPYKMVGPWKHNEAIELEQNTSYFGTPPVTPRVRFEISADADTTYARYADGQVDISEVPVGRMQEAEARGGGRAKSWPTALVLFLGMPVGRAPFDDANLRHALSLSIDRAAIASRILENTATPATGVVPPLAPGQSATNCADCRYDPTAAKKLIGNKKYPKLRIYTDAGSSFTPALRVISDGWRSALGIDSEVVERDATELADDLSAGKIDGLFYSGWVPDYASAYAVLDPLYATGSPDNQTGFSSADVDAALADARRAPSLAAADAPLARAERGVTDELPVLPLVFSDVVYATSNRVRDFTVDGLGNLRLERVRIV